MVMVMGLWALIKVRMDKFGCALMLIIPYKSGIRSVLAMTSLD